MNTSGTNDGLRLAELLANRLCHDLSGPLNGLGAGLAEAVAGSPMAADGLALAREAASVTISRLILLRAAWGEVGDALDGAGLARLASGLPGRRVRADLSGIAGDVVFGPMASRLLLNVMLLGAECLPRGGTVRLAGDPAGGIVALIDGPQAAWPESLPGLIAAPATASDLLREASPRDIQAPMTIMMAAAAGQSLSLLLGSIATAAPPLLVSVRDA